MRRSASRTLAIAFLVGCASEAPPPPAAPPAAVTPVAAVVGEGPPVALDEPAEARGRLLATVTIPSIDRTMSSAAGVLNQAQPGMYQADMLRTMLIGQMGLPSSLAGALDTGASVGVAVVSAAVNAAPGVAIAVGTRGGDMSGVAAGLGKELGRRGDALQVQTSAGQKLWALPLGGSLVLADSVDSLAHGARTAVAARRPGDEDATVVLFPDAIARHRGTDVKAALAKAKADMREAQAALGTGKGRADIEAGSQMMDGLFDKLADAETVEVGLRLAEGAGLSCEARFRPRSGSALEKDARETRPFEIDPGLLAGDGLAGLFAGSYGPVLRKQAELFKGKLARNKGPGGAQALELYDASLAAIDGRFAAALRLKPHLNIEISYALKDDAGASRLEKSLGAVKKDALMAILRAQAGDALGEPAVTLKPERIGKGKAIHTTIDFSSRTARTRDLAMIREAFGEVKVEAYAAVVGKRVVATVGENAKTRLLALATGSPAAPDRDLAAALGESRGRDSFAYVDLGTLARMVAKMSGSPQAAMLGGFRARVPVFGTIGSGGGSYVSVALRVPVAAFAAVGAFFQMAAGGGAIN